MDVASAAVMSRHFHLIILQVLILLKRATLYELRHRLYGNLSVQGAAKKFPDENCNLTYVTRARLHCSGVPKGYDTRKLFRVKLLLT